ncbi:MULTISPECIES: hypothetical protein [unclassified Flavobacterium]|uniref:hypothetical protein n=1 Tax=unclassified Flavobacterium TaxID=196869 RepID=UPI000960FAF3|nr:MULTISPECIES: hypothetical protein [unclassified Flavobacterium]MBN9283245.1 hypothetical protein [Flavobacterium sp.]OJV70020.1 MAG: hypothetical protein BGO42_11180 [Flavobacterium sp. 40-81]
MKKNITFLAVVFSLGITSGVYAQVNDNGTNVGIGIAAPPVAFGTDTNIKLDIDGGVRNGNKGDIIAQRFSSGSIYSTTNSLTTGIIGYNSNWSAQSTTLGISCNVDVTQARSPFGTSQTLGGKFTTKIDGISGSNPFNIGGVFGNLKGAWNGTLSSGYAGAVIGIDEINGSSTYGGYFEGKGYFSNKTGIGTKNFPTTIGGANISSYNLFVKGGILTDEVRVRTGWADYVFADDYTLKPLAEVAAFIAKNKHLPNVPSEKQVAEEGLSLGEISKIQQEKIEELVLYLINQEKRIEALEAKINQK